MIKGNEKKIILTLVIGIFSCLFLLLFITINYKPFSTGLVTKDYNIKMTEVITPPMDPNKNCYFELGDKSIAMFNCNSDEDCYSMIDDLIELDEVKKNYDIKNVRVIDCFLNK